MKLRKTYLTIFFPVTDTAPEAMLALYRHEFDVGKVLDKESVRLLFVHALHDYLSGHLNEHAFGSLCFAISTAPEVRKLLDHEMAEFRAPLDDCVDIVWLATSPDFASVRTLLAVLLTKLTSPDALRTR